MNVVYFTTLIVLRAYQCYAWCEERDLEPDDVCFNKFPWPAFPGGDYVIESFVIPLTACSNLENTCVHKAWGVDTNNHKCVQLYDQQNCTGNTIRLTPRSVNAHILGGWGFEERTASFGVCQESCTPDVGHAIEKSQPTPIAITLYSQVQFAGKAITFLVRNCTKVTKLNPLNEKYKSLQLPKGGCILAFMGNYSEDVEEANPCLVRNYQSVLELYNGVPNLDFFEEWYIHPFINPAEYLMAVAPCQCNYVRYPAPAPTGRLFVILYLVFEFKGNSIQVSMNFTGCKDFASDFKLRSWEGLAASVFVANDTCVQAYKQRNCGDVSYTTLNTSVANLIDYRLLREIRSLSACSEDYNADDLNGNVSETESSLSNYLIPILGVGGFVCAVLASFVIYMRRRALRMKNQMREMLSDKEIEDFLNGLRLDLDGGNDETERQEDDTKSQIGPAATCPRPDVEEISFEVLAQNQPYNYELEILRTDLKFDSKCPIGEGQYGLIFKGTLTREDKAHQVAIKTTKPLAAVQYLRALLKEVKVMMYVGQHSKIVTLIGCCTANLREGDLLIVMEFCDNGSLEGYLKSNRATFVNLTTNGEIRDEPDLNSKSVMDPPSNDDGIYCINLHPTSGSPNSEEMKSQTEFNILQLICWSIEISEGMDFLASKKIIHGDLSARNILLNAGKTAKISDFGLARKLYSYEQYIRNGEDALPWRWLALESLKNMEFSTASDIWGYGILLWEIFTLAEQPYPGIPFWSADFITNLGEGLRPTFPPFATKEIYDIMCCCWREIPKFRPSFFTLNTKLQKVKVVCMKKLKAEIYKIIHFV